jgi:hypothetical protein
MRNFSRAENTLSLVPAFICLLMEIMQSGLMPVSGDLSVSDHLAASLDRRAILNIVQISGHANGRLCCGFQTARVELRITRCVGMVRSVTDCRFPWISASSAASAIVASCLRDRRIVVRGGLVR